MQRGRRKGHAGGPEFKRRSAGDSEVICGWLGKVKAALRWRVVGADTVEVTTSATPLT